ERRASSGRVAVARSGENAAVVRAILNLPEKLEDLFQASLYADREGNRDERALRGLGHRGGRGLPQAAVDDLDAGGALDPIKILGVGAELACANDAPVDFTVRGREGVDVVFQLGR